MSSEEPDKEAGNHVGLARGGFGSGMLTEHLQCLVAGMLPLRPQAINIQDCILKKHSETHYFWAGKWQPSLSRHSKDMNMRKQSPGHSPRGVTICPPPFQGKAL
jgi:hypothetical protein